MMLQMMDVQTIKYVFRCKLCHKSESTNDPTAQKYGHGVILKKTDLNSVIFLKQSKRRIEKHVNDALLLIQSVKCREEQHILESPLHNKIVS